MDAKKKRLTEVVAAVSEENAFILESAVLSDSGNG